MSVARLLALALLVTGVGAGLTAYFEEAIVTYASIVLTVAAAVALFVIERAKRADRQARIKRALRRVPVYRQLLEAYPQARLVLSR